MSNPKYTITIAAGYLKIVCAEHKKKCSVHYRGLDPMKPLIEIVCPDGHSSGQLKLDGKGNEGWLPTPGQQRKKEERSRKQKLAAINQEIRSQLEKRGLKPQ